MPQLDSLRELDGEIYTALSGAGLADAATYTPNPPGAPVACGVYVDRGLRYDGFDAQAQSNLITITAFLAEIGSKPNKGATFQVGAEVFTVDRVETVDESRVLCTVRA